MEGNARSLYSKTLELEKQLRSLLRQNPEDKAIPPLRTRIREYYKEIILSDFDFAVAKEVEQNLWKIGFYKSIEEYRKAIRKYATATANVKKERGHPTTALRNQLRGKCAEFREFLANAMAFYSDLIQRLKAKYNLSLNGSVVYDATLGDIHEISEGMVTRSSNKAYLSCHKCFIFLGDLTRYHRDLYGEPEATQKDWTLAENYYRQALALVPDSGNPHNQLAVVATYRDDELEAVYRYFRSLAVKIPFTTANDNLRVLFEKNKDKLIHILEPKKAESRSGHISRKDKTAGPPDELKLFALRFVRLHGILFTVSSLETFTDLKAIILKQLDSLLSRNALDSIKLLKLLLINIFSFHRSLREGQDSVTHRYAYQLTLEVTCKIAEHTPYGDPHPPSPYLPHLSVFLEWALHHQSLLTPMPEEEDINRQLGKILAPILTSIFHSIEGKDEMLPPTLAEEFDMFAFLPLSTTFAPMPPPSAPSSHSHRLAKMRTIIDTLIQIQPSWAFFEFDEQSESFTATSTHVVRTRMENTQSQSPQHHSQAPEEEEEESVDLDKHDEEEEHENENENEIEVEEENYENENEGKVGSMSMDMDASPHPNNRDVICIEESQKEEGEGEAVNETLSVPPSPYEFNDDEVADDEVDEVILFNPFVRPNQNHSSMPIGGERLRNASSEEDIQTKQNVSRPSMGNPSLYTPPHRQGLDINLHLRSNEQNQASHHPPQPLRLPSSSPVRSSPPPTTPPTRKTLAPPPGFPPLPPGFSSAPGTESLFSTFQPSAASPQGETFTSFFGLGSPIAPSHVAYPFSYRQSASPSSTSSWSPMAPPSPQLRPPPGFSPIPHDTTNSQQGGAVTSVAWPFAPHRAEQAQQHKGRGRGGNPPPGTASNSNGWMSSWQAPTAPAPPRQWQNWQGDTPIRTNNPFLT